MYKYKIVPFSFVRLLLSLKSQGRYTEAYALARMEFYTWPEYMADALDGFSAAIGAAFLPAVIAAGEAITGFAQAWAGMSGAHGK